MSLPKRGLGRGLSSLLGEPRQAAVTGTIPPPSVAETLSPVVVAPLPSTGAARIRVDAIKPNPRQPRTIFDAEALAELQQSIRELGVLLPIIVRARGEEYELIAGERRWRAAAALQLETIPAIVRDTDDRTSLEIAIVENVLRSDLDPLEEAMGYANLMEEYGYTQERVAERLGKRRSTIANALRLIALPDSIKADVRAGTLSVGHARALLTVQGERQLALARRVAEEGLTVRDVERLAAESAARKPRVSHKPVPGKNPDIERAESTLRYRLGTYVVVEPGIQGGRIAIRYADEEDLIRLVDLLIAQ